MFVMRIRRLISILSFTIVLVSCSHPDEEGIPSNGPKMALAESVLCEAVHIESQSATQPWVLSVSIQNLCPGDLIVSRALLSEHWWRLNAPRGILLKLQLEIREEITNEIVPSAELANYERLVIPPAEALPRVQPGEDILYAVDLSRFLYHHQFDTPGTYKVKATISSNAQEWLLITPDSRYMAFMDNLQNARLFQGPLTSNELRVSLDDADIAQIDYWGP